MKSATMLRLCVALELALIVISIVLSMVLQPFLPEPLRAWLAQNEQQLRPADLALFALFVPLLIALVVASVGLLLLKRWAAWLYLYVNVLGLLLVPFTGPTVEHAVAETFSEAGTMLGGVVLALAFFSDAIRRDEPHRPPPCPPRTAGA